jgi:hypothetical protein
MVPINIKDSTTLQNAETLKTYITNLNEFTTEYRKVYKSGKFQQTDTFDTEFGAIDNLLKKYSQLIKPQDEIVNKIFDIAIKSQELREEFNIVINDAKIIQDINKLKLTPDQAKLFKLEVIEGEVTAKRTKFKKVQRVLENVISRLRIRKRVLKRKYKSVATEPATLTVTDKFLDVVHNIDTALTWMDPEPTGLTPDEIAIEEVELMNIRANINAKLQDLQDSINAFALKKRSFMDTDDNTVQPTESTEPINDTRSSKRQKTVFKCSNVIQQCQTPVEPIPQPTPLNANTSSIATMITLTAPRQDCLDNIQTILGKLQEAAEVANGDNAKAEVAAAANEANEANEASSVFAFATAAAATQDQEDVVDILASLKNSITYNESMSSIDLGETSSGGKPKK